MSAPTIAISMGDPGGIGPEVVVKALSATRAKARFVILGAGSCLTKAARAAKVGRFWTACGPGEAWPDGHVLIDYEQKRAKAAYAPKATRAGGELSFRFVSDAITLAKSSHGPRADAVVTAPISKKAWQLAGHGDFPGHTELLARLCGVERFGMFFHAPPVRAGPGMNVILATVHVPLSRVREHLSVRRVVDTIALGHEAMRRLNVAKPRIAVCGLNPHAGEDGLLGTDEEEVIIPAITESRRSGIDVSGPFPGDTIFQRALSRPGKPAAFDLVVAMYHDQGLIPLKTLAWDRAVNMTVGLPIVRTSPDHGTAFDLAGKNRADPGSMRAAVELAARMAAGRS